jgi:TP901 family phage tail tape measure protein
MAGFGLRDIVLSIKLMIDRRSAQEMRDDLQKAINKGTAPDNAISQLNRLDNKIEALTKRAGALLAAFTAAFAGRVIFRFLEESTMMFAKFDQKLQQSVAIMGVAGVAMKQKLGETARQVAKELGVSADEIVEGYYYLVSAGLDAAQAIRALPLAATFAKAGLMSMKEATDFLAVSVSALGYASKDPEKQFASMTRVADVLALASKRSQGSLEQLVQALTNKAAGSLRIFHKEVEEGAAALMVLADAGVRGAVAGERLDIFMRQVTQAATKHPEAWKKMGIAVFDAQGRMRNFADISHDLTAALGGLTDESVTVAMSQLGIQQRTQASVKVFIGAEEKLREYEKAMKDAGGTTLKISDSMMNTPAERWNQFKEKIADARREIGENFAPVLTSMAQDMGDEDNPHSVVGILKQFSEGLGKSEYFLKKLGETIGWLIREPINWLIDGFNMVADVIVIALEAPVTVLAGALSMVGMFALIATAGIGEFLKAIHLDGASKKVLDFADKIDKVTQKVEKFTGKMAESNKNNAIDFWERLTESGSHAHDHKTKPRLIDGKPTKASSRDGKGMGDDTVDGETDDEKKAKRGADKREMLDDKLNRMLAKHTKERVDDELLQLRILEREYKEFYKGRLPDYVVDGIKSIENSIKQEGAAAGMEEMFKDLFGGDLEDGEVDFAALQEYIFKLQELKDQAEKGSDEWERYNKLLSKAIELQTDAARKVGKEDDERKKKEEDAKDRDREKRLRKMQRIAEHVGVNMANAFEQAFEALTSGSRRGIDALHVLKGVALSALTAPLAEYAMNKAKEQFLEAGNDVAAGFSALANPFTSWMAPMYFKSAAMHAAQGTAWGALAGGAAAGSAGLAGGGAGKYADHGRGSVDKSSPKGPDINIYIDGVDPKNPNHQKLLGQTMEEYIRRGGGNLNIRTKR